MSNSLSMALEKVHSGVGQGSLLEQIDKRYRKQQRISLFEMLEKVDNIAVQNFPVVLYKHVAQNGKSSLPYCGFLSRCGLIMTKYSGKHLEIIIILAVHRVKDLEFDRLRGGTVKIGIFRQDKRTNKIS